MCAAYTDFDYIPYEEKCGPCRVNRKYQRPQMGDLLEIDHGYYKHWAVYIGDSEVVHKTWDFCSFVLTENGHEIRIRPSVIRRDAFHDVVDQKYWKISNKLGKSMFSPEEIRKRALDKLGTATYNLFTDNCEHFANYCRYNYRCSFQADLLWRNILLLLFRPSIFVGAMTHKQSIFTLPPKHGVIPSCITDAMLSGAFTAFLHDCISQFIS